MNMPKTYFRKIDMPKNILGKIAFKYAPNIYQLFITLDEKVFNDQEFETNLLQARKFIEELYLDDETLYICSFSSKTIVYKGLMLPDAIKEFYIDISQKDFRASSCNSFVFFAIVERSRCILASVASKRTFPRSIFFFARLIRL